MATLGHVLNFKSVLLYVETKVNYGRIFLVLRVDVCLKDFFAVYLKLSNDENRKEPRPKLFLQL